MGISFEKWMRDGLKEMPIKGIGFDAFLVDQREEVLRLLATSAAQVRGGTGPDDQCDTNREKAEMTFPGQGTDIRLRPPLNHHGLPCLVGFPETQVPVGDARPGPVGVHFLPVVPGYTNVHKFVAWCASALHVQGGMDGVFYVDKVPWPEEKYEVHRWAHAKDSSGEPLLGDFFDAFSRPVIHNVFVANRTRFGTELSAIVESLEATGFYATGEQQGNGSTVSRPIPLSPVQFKRTEIPMRSTGVEFLQYTLRWLARTRPNDQLNAYCVATRGVTLAIVYGLWEDEKSRSVIFSHPGRGQIQHILPEQRVMIHQWRGDDGIWRWRSDLALKDPSIPEAPLPGYGLWEL